MILGLLLYTLAAIGLATVITLAAFRYAAWQEDRFWRRNRDPKRR